MRYSDLQGSGLPVTIDPQRLPGAVAHEDYVGFHYDAAANPKTRLRAVSSDDFWTQAATVGDVAAVVADDTYAVLTNVTSGSGVLLNLVFPGVAAAGGVVTARITRDGREYIVSGTAQAATDRFMFAVIERHGGYENVVLRSHYPEVLVSGVFFGHTVNDTGSTTLGIVNPLHAMASGIGLEYKTSLKIEVKVSVVEVSSNRDNALAVYTTNQY